MSDEELNKVFGKVVTVLEAFKADINALHERTKALEDNVARLLESVHLQAHKTAQEDRGLSLLEQVRAAKMEGILIVQLKELAGKWELQSKANYGQGQWAQAHDTCAAELRAVLEGK